MVRDNMALWAVILHTDAYAQMRTDFMELEQAQRWLEYWDRYHPGRVSLIRTVNDQRLFWA